MTSSVEGPVIVIEGADVMAYEDAASAEGDLEVFDVQDGSLEAFGLAGNRLELVPDGWRVRIRRPSTVTGNRAELTERVRAGARDLGRWRPPLSNVDTASLEELAAYIIDANRPRPKRRRKRKRGE